MPDHPENNRHALDKGHSPIDRMAQIQYHMPDN
jgi:hypothetical protein